MVPKMNGPPYAASPTFGPPAYPPVGHSPFTPGMQPMAGVGVGYPGHYGGHMGFGGHLTQEDRRMVNKWMTWHYVCGFVGVLVFIGIVLIIVFVVIKPTMETAKKEHDEFKNKHFSGFN